MVQQKPEHLEPSLVGKNLEELGDIFHDDLDGYIRLAGCTGAVKAGVAAQIPRKPRKVATVAVVGGRNLAEFLVPRARRCLPAGVLPAARDIFERFEFHTQNDRLAKAGLLYLETEKFANIDLHPETVDNAAMGAVFEELIRKFAELSNGTAGEHFI
jgi:type I restriction-modification system DNA methylase subunit